MNLIDPKAGTHFTGKIFVVPHALDRTAEHFGIDRSQAPMWVMDRLRKAALVDPNVIGEDGIPRRLFAFKRIAFIVAQHEDTVITVYPQENSPAPVIDGVQRVLAAALRTAQRKEAREVKRLTIMKAQLAVEKAECELRKVKSGSKNVIRAMDERLNAINAEVSAIDTQIYEVRREKLTLAKGICAFI